MSNSKLNITIAQLNPTVGAVSENMRGILKAYQQAEDEGADLLVTPELSLTGYMLKGLVTLPDFNQAVHIALTHIKKQTLGKKAALVVGAPIARDGEIYDMALIIKDGQVIHEVARNNFSEARALGEDKYFSSSHIGNEPFKINDVYMALCVGEDGLNAKEIEWRLSGSQSYRKASLIINVAAIPFTPGRYENTLNAVKALTAFESVPFIHVNQVGGQGDCVFDGASFVLKSNQELFTKLPEFAEQVVTFDCYPGQDAELARDLSAPERLWQALVTGTRDYVKKSGFSDVLLGMSGGMDSALVAAIAGDALGAEHVHCYRLPSEFTSVESNNLADEMCQIWNMPISEIAIGGVNDAALSGLKSHFAAKPRDVTEENLQSRIRGMLLMALSNKNKWLLLSTGNKSESLMGYCTLYGDMCGAFNPVKDIYKTTVFELARWRNQNRPEGLLGPGGEVIPKAIIARPPSAELSADQKDSDSLPEYSVLDRVLASLVDEGKSVAEVAAEGFDETMVKKVYATWQRNEFKRQQAAPGVVFSRHDFPLDGAFNIAMLNELNGLEK